MGFLGVPRVPRVLRVPRVPFEGFGEALSFFAGELRFLWVLCGRIEVPLGSLG